MSAGPLPVTPKTRKRRTADADRPVRATAEQKPVLAVEAGGV